MRGHTIAAFRLMTWPALRKKRRFTKWMSCYVWGEVLCIGQSVIPKVRRHVSGEAMSMCIKQSDRNQRWLYSLSLHLLMLCSYSQSLHQLWEILVSVHGFRFSKSHASIPITYQDHLYSFISYCLFFANHVPIVQNNRKAWAPTSVIRNRVLTRMGRMRHSERTKVPHTLIMHDNSPNTPDCSFLWGKLSRNHPMQPILPENEHHCYTVSDSSVMQLPHRSRRGKSGDCIKTCSNKDWPVTMSLRMYSSIYQKCFRCPSLSRLLCVLLTMCTVVQLKRSRIRITNNDTSSCVYPNLVSTFVRFLSSNLMPLAPDVTTGTFQFSIKPRMLYIVSVQLGPIIRLHPVLDWFKCMSTRVGATANTESSPQSDGIRRRSTRNWMLRRAKCGRSRFSATSMPGVTGMLSFSHSSHRVKVVALFGSRTGTRLGSMGGKTTP